MNKINIAIPKPCHENWNQMSAAEKGKFCSVCAKNVYDFTKSSDREILQKVNTGEDLCGRFLKSQLNRGLVVPKEKPAFWIAAATGVLGFLSLGSHETFAQVKPETEQTDAGFALGKFVQMPKSETKITGIVSESGFPLPGAIVTVKNTKRAVQTDVDGKFEIEAKAGEVLAITFVGLESKDIQITDATQQMQINLKQRPEMGLVIVVKKKRTLFGRAFHSIGSIFR